MKFFKSDTQYPITIDLMYDLDSKFGLINSLVTANRKTLENFHIYMFVKYGIKLNYVEKSNPEFIFNKNNIECSLDEDLKEYHNISLIINDKECFKKFLGMFEDEFYSQKHSKKIMKFYHKDKTDWYSGCEIELTMKKECDTPEQRSKLINALKEKYENVIFTQTEGFRNQLIEINSYPMPIEDLYKICYVIDLAFEYGMDTNWSCNFQTHISKTYFGNTKEEAKKNINKFVYYIYLVDDFINERMFNPIFKNWNLLPTFKHLIHDKDKMNYQGIVAPDKIIDIMLENRDKVRDNLAPYYINFPRLLDDFENEPTLEFRLADLKDVSHEGIWLLVAFTEFCVTVVMKKTLEEISKMSIQDFYNFFEKKKKQLINLPDFD